ncbi:DUF590-domain-containing protein [Dendrothele bispora CBS 962.96]|uniref:DUF590-domain-containing protein n=1 Tax=Dendrothele bispora (strain CBS 962.96) TaxID=1314807 RepID=A0A4S8LYB2_DENBC|nr:DUF590-domain-containing protein [Dendrothele bispora CBS 962.96]
MTKDVDIIIEFRAAPRSKRQTREDARKAQLQYSRLLETLNSKGLKAVGRRGEALGHLFVFVHCPPKLLNKLVKRERESDFLHGLPTTPYNKDGPVVPLSPATRIRLVNRYVTSLPSEGGLGISPGSPDWDLVESVFCLHDREFNQEWIHAWTTSKVTSVEEERVRAQFGDSVALYFSFLFGYTRALFIPATIGTLFYFFGKPYSPLYSILTVLWSITFVEWWRVNERLLALRYGVRGSFRVEKRRAEHKPGTSWWQRELRILASVPVMLPFVLTLFGVLTFNFIIESFVAELYKGPGHKYIAFAPTILFAAFVPRLQSIFQFCATKLTFWENHAHHSTHTASLTLKSFVFTALVAYAGLALTAFVYVPFGEPVLRLLQVGLLRRFADVADSDASAGADAGSDVVKSTSSSSFWNLSANMKFEINQGKLQKQLFAYTVTNQIVNTFMEVGLPFVMRRAKTMFAKKSSSSATSSSSSSSSAVSGSNTSNNNNNNGGGSSGNTPAKKKVVFFDEQPIGGAAETAFLDLVRSEASLPPYDVFLDYSEMVVQFGYVSLWSTIWPLAPLMALLNNVLELRSDAFKMTVHARRPVPERTDTVGPWLEVLGWLGWMGAVTNAALVYLFCERGTRCDAGGGGLSAYEAVHRSLLNATVTATSNGGVENPAEVVWGETEEAMGRLLVMALLIGLAASHGYILVKAVISHVVERVMWKGSKEVRGLEEREREVKEVFLRSLGGGGGGDGAEGEEQQKTEVKVDVRTGPRSPKDKEVLGKSKSTGEEEEGEGEKGEKEEEGEEQGLGESFWEHDEGIDEIGRISKEA